MESQQKAAGSTEKGSTTACNLVLRVLAIAATLAAAILMGVDEETKNISITIAPSLPPLSIAVTAKSNYSSAFMYFVVINAIACFYSLASLAATVANKSRKSGPALVVAVADTVMLALLFSGNGAATAVGMVGEKGISKVGWNKVCNVYTKFCAHVTASVVVSFVACLAYLVLVLLALVALHKRSP